jgi:hypothetical protein
VVTLVSALIVAVAVVFAGMRVAAAVRAPRAVATSDRALQLIELFAPAVAAADRDVRAILVWQPLAAAARRVFAEEFAMLDRAAGATFPFSAQQVDAAHARWTADWLSWEHSHDVEFKLKEAVVEQEIAASGGSSPLARARFDAIEREKLELYQRRYEEYIRIAKALQALAH